MKKFIASMLLAATLGLVATPHLDAQAVGGRKYTSTHVNAVSQDSYTIRFYGGELAMVSLSGDGDTDLDLYVYDTWGNLVGRDIDGTDDCLVMWTPSRTAEYRIVVKNLGIVYNDYTLVTN